MHQGRIQVELIGGGPQDGLVDLLDTPIKEIRIAVPRADIFFAAANQPTQTTLFHLYTLHRATQQAIYYKYQGYTT